MNNTASIAYSVAIFLALALGGLMVLRRERVVGMRVVGFLLLASLCVLATLWTTKRWQLLMGEATLAWIVALLLVGVVEGIRVWRVKRHSPA
jgi:hypothetical protein